MNAPVAADRAGPRRGGREDEGAAGPAGHEVYESLGFSSATASTWWSSR
jgi:hypothetical protein